MSACTGYGCPHPEHRDRTSPAYWPHWPSAPRPRATNPNPQQPVSRRDRRAAERAARKAAR